MKFWDGDKVVFFFAAAAVVAVTVVVVAAPCSCLQERQLDSTRIRSRFDACAPAPALSYRRTFFCEAKGAPSDEGVPVENDNDGEPVVGEEKETETTTKASARRRSKDRWITCSSTKELAQLARQFVRPGHRVAELCSQLREVSTAVCESLEQGSINNNNDGGGGRSRAVLVDVDRKFPQTVEDGRTLAMRLPGDEANFFPAVATYVEIPRLDDWRRAFLNATSSCSAPGFDVLVLDINAVVGNDLGWTSLAIAREFTALFESCETVLMKSVSLNQFSTRLIHGQRWIARNGVPRGRLTPPRIVATVGVQEYRATIPHTIRPGDAVLELGCHLGTTTALLYESCSDAANGKDTSATHCIGVDVGSKIIRGAKERHPGVYFAVGDAWKVADLLRIQQEFIESTGRESQRRIGFDVVYVDVGGISGSDGLLEAVTLLSALANGLEPRCIVIKSLCMRRLSSTLIPAWYI